VSERYSVNVVSDLPWGAGPVKRSGVGPTSRKIEAARARRLWLNDVLWVRLLGSCDGPASLTSFAENADRALAALAEQQEGV
jgi:hypothetical protein